MLLQMPLVCLRIDFDSGTSESFLVEHLEGCNYESLQSLIQNVLKKNSSAMASPPVSKDLVKSLLGICQSDRERECIKYTMFKASGLSSTQIRKQYGFEGMIRRSKKVEGAIMHSKHIRESIERLARIEKKAVLRSMGVHISDTDSSSDESTDDSDDDVTCHRNENLSMVNHSTDPATVIEAVRKSLFNYFEIVEHYPIAYSSLLEIVTPELSKEELQQLQVSYEAFCIDSQLDDEERQREVNSVNGVIVSDSESDDVKTVLDDKMKAIVEKKYNYIKRKTARLKAKQISEQNFLNRRVSRKLKGILKEFPDIGTTIEDFVKQNNVGADKWRRTGLLTFDGNVRDSKKVTYERIRQHLIATYNQNFSYGTTVQLCVARNSRRKSAMRYKGVAQVISRRARKGFQLRYNPDFHWSCALYSGLNYTQYSDRRNIINVNRDDAAGYRLDTLATNNQYSTPTVRGSEILTTHTDYVNHYKSVLQTTSYNFTSTKTTMEYCAGVVKAVPLFEKSPSQHSADFSMLQHKSELRNVFFKPNGDQKMILCVRVDGTCDEGPSHEEVQYYWTRDHLLNERMATLVTTRSSGSSFLNRVELQNGCLSRGHSNLFIPSTLSGSCIENGEVNNQILCKNLDLAIDPCISYVDKSPCGETVIHLYNGA